MLISNKCFLLTSKVKLFNDKIYIFSSKLSKLLEVQIKFDRFVCVGDLNVNQKHLFYTTNKNYKLCLFAMK